MKTISGKVISTTPISLSDAAAILSDFAATETGASDAVSVYIRRAADAFNQLVQFHNELRSSNSRLNRSKNHQIIAKEEEQQFPEVKHPKKKHKNDRDLDFKNEVLVKTEPDSLATEEHRKNKNYGAEKVMNEYEKVKNEYGKVKTESSLKKEPELDVVEGDSMKKDKKKKKKKLSEGNEGVGGETLVVETKKRKSEDIDGGLACGSDEQNSKKKSKKQRVEGK